MFGKYFPFYKSLHLMQSQSIELNHGVAWVEKGLTAHFISWAGTPSINPKFNLALDTSRNSSTAFCVQFTKRFIKNKGVVGTLTKHTQRGEEENTKQKGKIQCRS